MYTIKCDGYTLLNQHHEDYMVYDPVVELEVNTVGGAEFTILKNHPNYDKLCTLSSIFEIADEFGVIFRGRMTNDTVDFDNGKTVDLEGALAFLNDTPIPPFNFPEDFLNDAEYIAAAESGNVVEFFLSWILKIHNRWRRSSTRMLRLGNVTVKDPNNYITRSSESWMTAWDVVNTKLFGSSLGGNLCIRYEKDANYIDYLAEFEETNTQEIRFGENLKDLNSENDATATYTAIIPLGAETENADGTKTRLTLSSVENGLVSDDIVKHNDEINNHAAFLYSKSVYLEYDFIFAPVSETTWDDITTVDALLQKGIDFLTLKKAILNTTVFSAVDLHCTDAEIRSFRIYKNVKSYSPVHGLDGTYPLSKLKIPLLEPQNAEITVGKTERTFTSKSSNYGSRLSAVEQSVSTVYSSSDIDAKLEKQKEDYTSKIEQLSDSITLEISGSLGSSASIVLNAGENVRECDIDLSQVRQAFADDNTAIAISAGLITFNAGTLIINSSKFTLNADGAITATDATISGTLTTVDSPYMAKLDSGGLELYFDNVLCGTINTKYWYGASTEGVSLRVEEGGNYIMFSHYDETQGSGYTVDYYLNVGWSSNYEEMHIFQTSARFLSDVYLDGYTRIRSLRLFGANGEYLVGISSSGELEISKL